MHRDVPASLMVCANANALTAKSDALIVLRAKNQVLRDLELQQLDATPKPPHWRTSSSPLS